MDAAPTQLLGRLTDGDPTAAAEFMPLVYEQLRSMAAAYFRNRPKAQTLQPTALVHEAFLRMIDQTGARWQDRAHFCAACAVAMRQIMTDHIRRRRAAKRGGGWKRLELSGAAGGQDTADVDVVALDEAIRGLAERSERQARIVEYRFFGGLTVEEAACALGTSVSTVERDWRVARAWLSARLAERGEP